MRVHLHRVRDGAVLTGTGVSDYAAKQWNEIGIFRTFVSLFSVVMGMMLAAIIIVAVVGLPNTMLMTVLERQREIGVLVALGLSRRRVVAGP